jgi:hypothetical protein
LSWKPNDQGLRPLAYEVYGSNIKGFSVSKEPYDAPPLGEMPSNYLGRTTSTQMVVASHRASTDLPADVENPNNLNRCYYRVVAIDERGTHSGCSNYAEMPHPYIWTLPQTTIDAGREYRYQPCLIQSLGDLQFRYVEPNCRFWEREQLSFSLLDGPKWLSIDPVTGLLAGTAPKDGVDKYPICICVTATFEKRTGKDMFTDDLPSRSYQQRFELVVIEQ